MVRKIVNKLFKEETIQFQSNSIYIITDWFGWMQFTNGLNRCLTNYILEWWERERARACLPGKWIAVPWFEFETMLINSEAASSIIHKSVCYLSHYSWSSLVYTFIGINGKEEGCRCFLFTQLEPISILSSFFFFFIGRKKVRNLFVPHL